MSLDGFLLKTGYSHGLISPISFLYPTYSYIGQQNNTQISSTTHAAPFGFVPCIYTLVHERLFVRYTEIICVGIALSISWMVKSRILPLHASVFSPAKLHVQQAKTGKTIRTGPSNPHLYARRTTFVAGLLRFGLARATLGESVPLALD